MDNNDYRKQDEYISVRDAATRYGVTIDVIKKWCKDHKLTIMRCAKGIEKIPSPLLCEFDIFYSQLSPRLAIKKAINENNLNHKFKYELSDISHTNLYGAVLHRPRALIDFRTTTGFVVKKGDLGGWIESTHNLSQQGRSWIAQEAEVYNDARIIDNAFITGHTRVFGCARIGDNATLFDNAVACDHCYIGGASTVCDNGTVSDYAVLLGRSRISGFATVDNHSIIRGNSIVSGTAGISGFACLHTNAVVVNADVGGIESIGYDVSLN